MGVEPTRREIVQEEAAAGSAPSWLTWLLLVGLACTYAGERVFEPRPALRWVFTGLGVASVLAATLWRASAWKSTEGDARHVERTFLLGYAGCALAVMGFLLAGDLRTTLHLAPADPDTDQAFDTVVTLLSSILISVSLFPTLAAQWALGGNRVGRATGTVDRLRVSQLAAAGLTIGLAAPFLMLAGYVATKEDHPLDLSFFRTAAPGDASKGIVESFPTPLKVIFFFPPLNEVKEQVLGYFNALGSNVQIEEYDRLADPEIAEQYQVVADGTVILAMGERSEQLNFLTDMTSARLRLRELDSQVQNALMRVAREERTVYFTVGHGEMNSPASASASDTTSALGAAGGTYAVESVLGGLNFKFQNLTTQGGLGNGIPADAAMVVVLGPKRAFLPPELETLDRYLASGGSMLLAMEPESDFEMGPLTARVSLIMNKTPLADEQDFVPSRNNASDHRIFMTDLISSHEALPLTAEARNLSGFAVGGAGYLSPLPNPPGTKDVTYVVASREWVCADKDKNFDCTLGEEKREYQLAAAVKGPPVGAQGEVKESPGMRAIIVTDADAFTDGYMLNQRNEMFFTDIVRWLGHEENLGGETISQGDVPVNHTRGDNIFWFYTTILGAPAVILFLGLWNVRRRRKPVRLAEGIA